MEGVPIPSYDVVADEIMKLDQLRKRREEILQLAAKYGTHDMRVFASVVRNEVGKDGDVDLPIQMEPEIETRGMILE